MYHVSLAVQCRYGWSDEGGEDGDGKEGGRDYWWMGRNFEGLISTCVILILCSMYVGCARDLACPPSL